MSIDIYKGQKENSISLSIDITELEIDIEKMLDEIIHINEKEFSKYMFEYINDNYCDTYCFSSLLTKFDFMKFTEYEVILKLETLIAKFKKEHPEKLKELVSEFKNDCYTGGVYEKDRFERCKSAVSGTKPFIDYVHLEPDHYDEDEL